MSPCAWIDPGDGSAVRVRYRGELTPELKAALEEMARAARRARPEFAEIELGGGRRLTVENGLMEELRRMGQTERERFVRRFNTLTPAKAKTKAKKGAR